MKKRLPLLISFILFVALAGSVAYWGQQLFQPKARPTAAPPPPPPLEIPVEAAASLFGGKLVASTASNYQVKAVIASNRDNRGTVVIMADGQPAQTLGIGGEISPGVSVKEIHAQYVMLSDNGVPKRINLPEGKGQQSEGIIPVQADPGASRMTGPTLPIQQPIQQQIQQPLQPPPQGPTEPPQQPPVSPQQIQQAPQPGLPPQPPSVGPNGERLGSALFSKHNK